MIIKLPIISIHCLPEEIFQTRQLIARQMDDDWIFVYLTLEDMRSSGQQYGSVSSEGAGARIQGYISLQLLLQQPEEAHTNTLSETVPATCQSAKSSTKKKNYMKPIRVNELPMSRKQVQFTLKMFTLHFSLRAT